MTLVKAVNLPLSITLPAFLGSDSAVFILYYF